MPGGAAGEGGLAGFVRLRVPTNIARSAKNEEYRRNQHSAAPSGISGILDAQGAEKRQSQEPHSGPKGRRDSTAAARCAPVAWGGNQRSRTLKTTVFHQAPEKLRRYSGARVSSAWLRSPFRLVPAAGALSYGAAAGKRSTIPRSGRQDG